MNFIEGWRADVTGDCWLLLIHLPVLQCCCRVTEPSAFCH